MPNITLLLLLVSNVTLHMTASGESYNDLVDETTGTTESDVGIKKKRGRPRQKGESGNKEWEDDEIFALIDVWSGIKHLFNCKHPKYHLRDKKMKSLERIKGILHEKGIEGKVKQITDNIPFTKELLFCREK